jgi:uncharacterized protein YdaU (DUF1376 family)
MPLYVSDYLGDTQHLSTEEHGAFLLILMAMWQHGMLKNDPTILARMAKVNPRRWHLISEAIMPYFKVVDGFIISPRLQREHEKAVSLSKKQSANAARRYSDKPLNNNNPPPAMAVPNPCQTDASTSTPTKKEKEEGASAPVVGFQGRVVRLNATDYHRWKQNYPHVDLDAELSAHDAFLAGESELDQKRWFVRTATHLRNRNATMKANRAKPMTTGRLKEFAPEPPRPPRTPEEQAAINAQVLKAIKRP